MSDHKVLWRDAIAPTAENQRLARADIRPFIDRVDRIAREGAAARLAANPFPIRVALGVDQDEFEIRLTHGRQGQYAHPVGHIHLNHPCVPVPVTRFAQPKESQMIDKKQFVAQPVRTSAANLGYRHLGSLVTITTPTGAEITDTLFRISATKGMDEVGVELQNIDQVGGGEWFLEPKAIVLVRRPRPEPKKPAARKGR